MTNNVTVTEEPRARVDVNEEISQVIVTGIYGPKGEPGPPGDTVAIPDWSSEHTTLAGRIVVYDLTLWRALVDTDQQPSDSASDWTAVTLSNALVGQFFGLVSSTLTQEISDRAAGDAALAQQIDDLPSPVEMLQLIPEEVWNFTHSFPYQPEVDVMGEDGHLVLAEVRWPDSVTVQVGPFPIPSTGKVVIR